MKYLSFRLLYASYKSQFWNQSKVSDYIMHTGNVSDYVTINTVCTLKATDGSYINTLFVNSSVQLCVCIILEFK